MEVFGDGIHGEGPAVWDVGQRLRRGRRGATSCCRHLVRYTELATQNRQGCSRRLCREKAVEPLPTEKPDVA